MYEIEISNYDTDHDTWVTEKVHETNQDSMRRVKSCTFSRGVSMIQAADFQLLATNPAYNQFHEHTTLVKITNVNTGKVAFDGFVAKVYNDGMDASGVVQKSVSCDGCLSYLNETIQMYRKFENVPIGQVLNDDNPNRPKGLLTAHNAGAPTYKQIELGVCEFTDTLTFECKYESTLECIKKNILDVLPDAEISITRNQQGGLLLNITKGSSAVKKGTVIQLADNMVSMALETDASHIVTRLVPLGAYIEEEQTISGKKKKVRTNERATIAEAGNYTDAAVPTITHTAGNVYIDDSAAQAQYGIITGVATFDMPLTGPWDLLYHGVDYLKANNRIKKSYKAEVLDLSTIGLASDELEEGNVYRFYNKMIPINEDLRIQKITVDIFNAHKPTIEIGDKSEKITDVGAKQAQLIEYDMPEQELSILDSAKATASAIMNAGFEGYVVANDHEICIMNTQDKSTATKVWKWNIGGLAYASGQGAYDIPNPPVAITMDGAITADFITAGVLRGIEITNGNNTFHVDQNGNCTANSLSSNNATITGGSTVYTDAWGRTVTVMPGEIAFKDSNGNATLVFYPDGSYGMNVPNRGWVTGNFYAIPLTLNDHAENISQLQARVADHEVRISRLEQQ